jgi:signal transduction histidine kinase
MINWVVVIKSLCRSFGLLVFFVFTSAADAQPTVIFNGSNQVIGKSVAILEDPGDRYHFNTVRGIPSAFRLSTVVTPNLHLSTSSFWLKFSLKNQTGQQLLMLSLDYPTLNLCEFYYPAEGGYKVDKLSDEDPFNRRKYQHQNFLFDINLPAGQSATYYLHVKSNEQMVLPLIIGTPQKIAESLLLRDFLWGMFIGLTVVMILYNLVIFLLTKDMTYLYYVGYVTFISLTQTTLYGYTYHYLFYNWPVLFHKGLILFPAISGVCAILFVKSFLQTKSRSPVLNRFFIVPLCCYALAFIFRMIGFDLLSYRLIDVSALLLVVLIYVVAVKIAWQGYRPAKIFVVAWTIFFAGLILFILRNLDVLPYNNFTNYTIEAGIAIEVTLLSLALADRINTLKREKEQSQALALQAATENERIIREQNTILENRVNERTSALHELNKELITTLNDLQHAQSQLVESEKMASLGQLTAGIAHEINNPINFVISGIKPLQRDVDLIIESLRVFQHIAVSGRSSVEKEKEMEDYKNDLDWNYLQEEITYLFKGIQEGASRTADIVKGLRVFSRVDDGALKMADINEGIRSTLILVNNLLINRIRVNENYGELPDIACFPGKLNQVFLNILSNAIHAINEKFGDHEGGEIDILTYCDKDHVYVSFTDNGKGMDELTRKKIFEPFFTTKEVGEGVGLGMSMAYNTIKQHRGQITVKSELGRGAEFTILLPMK